MAVGFDTVKSYKLARQSICGGIDLLDPDLATGVPRWAYMKKAPKKSFADGYQAALNSAILDYVSVLQMEKDKPDTVDLDGPAVWRQKKVKEKAIQFFEILRGTKIDAKLLRIGFDELSTKGYLRKHPEQNMYHRFLSEGYSEGTSRSQAGQMHSLFTQLRMVVPDPATPNKLIVNPNSLLYEKALKAFKGV